MYDGSLGKFSNREDWIIQSPLIDDDGAEVTLTGSSIVCYVCKHKCPETAVLTATTDDGGITLPTATSFQIQFTPDDVSDLCAGQYDIYLRITIDDVTTQILAATVTVVEGGPE